MTPIHIRPAVRADVARVFELICELAAFENAREQVGTSPTILERDGFGPVPLYGLLVAEVEGEIVGIALTYVRYSTWKGKRLWLEDLIVTQSARGRGVGTALLDATIQNARETDCSGVMWQVLDWNESAIAFYRKFGARCDGEWVNVHLDF